MVKMHQDDINYIINEKTKVKRQKIKVKRNYIGRTLIILFVLLFYCLLSYLYIFCFEDHQLNESKQRGILLVFLPTLATITISVFLISGSENLKEYPSYKRKGILIFVLWMVPNIVFPLLLIVNIIPLSAKVFKLCVVLFVFSLSTLIPYVLIFIHSNILDILKRLFNFSSLLFIWEFKAIKGRTVEKANKRVDAMGRLVIRSIHEYDDNTFFIGLKKLEVLGKIILESSKINSKSLINSLFKNIITNHRYIASEGVKAELENYVRHSSSSISRLIKYGINCENEITSKINYPIAVTELEKVGIISVENSMNSVTRDIIENLGQLGEMSLNYSLDHPPDIEVLASFQEIGIECAKKKLENLCLETLIKIEFFGIEALSSSEPMNNSERKKEVLKVCKRALKSHWIVSAFLFKNIPETGEWLSDSRRRMEEDFGDNYKDAYNLVLKETELTSSVGKKILLDYKKAITKKRTSRSMPK